MSCKSALYGANTAVQTVSDGGAVSFGSVVRKYGNNAYLLGGNAVLNGVGYYDIDTNITFSSAAAGTANISLLKDGVAIPGASATITVEANANYSCSIPAVVRQFCCKESAITAVISGISATVANAAIVVEKI